MLVLPRRSIEPLTPTPTTLTLQKRVLFRFLMHSEIYREGLQFRRISTVAQKNISMHYHVFPMHDTLSRNCKYISFIP